jgi:hypothetical protein
MLNNPMDSKRIRTFPLARRKSLINIEEARLLPTDTPPDAGPLRTRLAALAERIREARRRNAAVILAYGAHLIKNGAGPLVNALIEGGFVTHVATQGAGVIHDWEFAFQGQSSESVRDHALVGRFGAWEETGRYLNLVALYAGAKGMGLGEAIGQFIAEDGLTLPDPRWLVTRIRKAPADSLSGARADLLAAMKQFGLDKGPCEVVHPFKQYSVAACAWRKRIPLTVHLGIGYDIIANHPMFNGAALGRSSATDARVMAQSCQNLSGGVYLSIGSAIMSPQVFEKAYSVANNLLEQESRPFVHDHQIVIVDLQPDGGWDWSQGEPPKDHPAYYSRFCKSFYRLSKDVQYFCCDNRVFLANLAALLHEPRFLRAGASQRLSAQD